MVRLGNQVRVYASSTVWTQPSQLVKPGYNMLGQMQLPYCADQNTSSKPPLRLTKGTRKCCCTSKLCRSLHRQSAICLHIDKLTIQLSTMAKPLVTFYAWEQSAQQFISYTSKLPHLQHCNAMISNTWLLASNLWWLQDIPGVNGIQQGHIYFVFDAGKLQMADGDAVH